MAASRQAPYAGLGSAAPDAARSGRRPYRPRLLHSSPVIGDDLRQAVLAREDVRRLYQPPDGDPAALERIEGYLEELRATQRHSIYRALKHPLYPILRKVERVPEGLPHLQRALDTGRVVYVSNHKSHLDYLIELLILEDHDMRPPIIAAGINLFGGALGLLHKHVTGAIPIRRGARDAAYLVTLKAFVAELLETHDLFFYPEGGRSYSGELKNAKTGLFNAVVLAQVPVLHIVPVAIAYDLVLEDRILAPQVTKGRQRPFSRELAEMVGTAVGYQSRAFVTFGAPVTLEGRRGALAARRDGSRAAGARRHRPVAQGAADGARGQRDAAIDATDRTRGRRPGPDRPAGGQPAPTWRRPMARGPWSTRWPCSRNAACCNPRATWSACAIASSSATTAVS